MSTLLIGLVSGWQADKRRCHNQNKERKTLIMLSKTLAKIVWNVVEICPP